MSVIKRLLPGVVIAFLVTLGYNANAWSDGGERWFPKAGGPTSGGVPGTPNPPSIPGGHPGPGLGTPGNGHGGYGDWHGGYPSGRSYPGYWRGPWGYRGGWRGYWGGWRGYWGPPPGYYYWGDNCWDCGPGAAVVGLTFGTILGSAMANYSAPPPPPEANCKSIVVRGVTYYNCDDRYDRYDRYDRNQRSERYDQGNGSTDGNYSDQNDQDQIALRRDRERYQPGEAYPEQTNDGQASYPPNAGSWQAK